MFSAVVCYSRFFSQPNTKHLLRARIVLCCLIVHIYPYMHAHIHWVSAEKHVFCLSIETKKFLVVPAGEPKAQKFYISIATRWSSGVCMYVRVYGKRLFSSNAAAWHLAFKLHWQGLCQMTVGVLHVRARRDLGDKRFGHDIIMFRHNVKQYHDLQHMQQIYTNM